MDISAKMDHVVILVNMYMLEASFKESTCSIQLFVDRLNVGVKNNPKFNLREVYQ